MSRRPARVGRLSRLIDVASLVLILAGAGVFVAADMGMRELRDSTPTEFVRGETAYFEKLNEHARLRRLSLLGLGVAGLGLVVGLSAAAHAHRLSRNAGATATP